MNFPGNPPFLARCRFIGINSVAIQRRDCYLKSFFKRSNLRIIDRSIVPNRLQRSFREESEFCWITVVVSSNHSSNLVRFSIPIKRLPTYFTPSIEQSSLVNTSSPSEPMKNLGNFHRLEHLLLSIMITNSITFTLPLVGLPLSLVCC